MMVVAKDWFKCGVLRNSRPLLVKGKKWVRTSFRTARKFFPAKTLNRVSKYSLNISSPTILLGAPGAFLPPLQHETRRLNHHRSRGGYHF